MNVTPKIVIEAPQGWGKTWLANQIAEEVRKWKGCAVVVLDSEGDEQRFGDSVVGMYIEVKQSK